MNVTATGDATPPENALFSVETEYEGRCARCTLRGELDLATVRVLDEELQQVWSREPRRVELDLRGLEFIGSSGIAALLEANARARERGCALTLVRGPAAVHRIFELTGIESQFAFRPASVRREERPARGGPLGIVR
jgi:anti-sigma B factor antagonist